MSQVCREPLCPAALQSAWWNWNWITKLTKYLVERDEEMGMDPVQETMWLPSFSGCTLPVWRSITALELHLLQLSSTC